MQPWWPRFQGRRGIGARHGTRQPPTRPGLMVGFGGYRWYPPGLAPPAANATVPSLTPFPILGCSSKTRWLCCIFQLFPRSSSGSALSLLLPAQCPSRMLPWKRLGIPGSPPPMSMSSPPILFFSPPFQALSILPSSILPKSPPSPHFGLSAQ